MKQIISKGGRVVCVTTAPYPKETVKAMKAAGYKITEEKDGKQNVSAVNN
mgnify:CR=1 FL=1